MSTTEKKLAIVRGGGDLGTGVIYRLWRAHFKVLVLEIERPLVVRINVSAANAIFCGETEIEGMRIKRIDSPAAFNRKSDDIEIIVSPGVELIEKLRPQVLIDAIMAKRNTGTVKDMAPIVIGVVTTVGLIAALLGSGLWNVLSWLCLAAPVWITLHYWARSQR